MALYRALLVANSKYNADPDHLPELKAPIYDMSRLRDALIHPELGVFLRDQVLLLPNLQSADILAKMEDFFLSAEPQDTLLLYYSGHGKLDINNNFFLCATNTRIDRLQSTAIPDDQVNAMIRRSPARTFVLILDCCTSGSWKSATDIPDALKGVGRFLIASSRAGQNSGDAAVETESSPFTKLLVEALETADLDTDKDGYVDIDAVYKHVEERLRVEGQQAQRDFGKSTRSVALARRRVSASSTEPKALHERVGANEIPTLAVAPEEIRVSDVGLADLPAIERIYVFNRGGGTLSWDADSDHAWITVQHHPDFVRVSLAPRSVGISRGSVYVRDRGLGGVRRVPVIVEVTRDAAPDPAPRQAIQPSRIDPPSEAVQIAPRSKPPAPPASPARNRKRLEAELEKRGYELDPWSANIFYGDDYLASGGHTKPRVVIRATRIRIERYNRETRAYRLWRSYSLEHELDAAIETIGQLKRSGAAKSEAPPSSLSANRTRLEKELDRRGSFLGPSAKHLYYDTAEEYPYPTRIAIRDSRIRIEKLNRRTWLYELRASFSLDDELGDALDTIGRLKRR